MNQPSPGYRLVTSGAELAALSERWRQAPAIALDTEFVRTRTYYARLGLLQVAEGDQVWLVDATAITDWSPICRMFADPGVVKILHAGGEDLQLFQQHLGQLPSPLFDTQIAATVAGHGGAISYQNLVEKLLGMPVAKDQTRSDWMRRPLSERQLRYAADDVRFLTECHHQLEERLRELARSAWNAEDNERLLDPHRLEPSVADLYARFGQTWKMDDAQRSHLWRLCDWRETTARQRDLPRTWLIKNPALATLANDPPSAIGTLARIDGIDGRTLRRHGRELIELLRQEPLDPPPPPAPRPLDAAQRAHLKVLKTNLEKISEQLEIPTDFLVTRKDLERVVRGTSVDRVLTGWRFQNLAHIFTFD